MTEVIIYTTPSCPYCQRAKALLRHKELGYREIDVSEDVNLRQQMVDRSGGRQTVPQIFINGIHIGGFDDLYKLEKEGALDAMMVEQS